MDSKNGINFVWIVTAFILGTTLFKHFNFRTFSFKVPALDIVFLVALIATVYFMIKDYKSKQKNKSNH